MSPFYHELDSSIVVIIISTFVVRGSFGLCGKIEDAFLMHIKFFLSILNSA